MPLGLIAAVQQPGRSSPQARAIDDLFQGSFLICGAIFVVVTALVLYAVIRFKKRGDDEPKQVEGHTRLEIAWTLVPVLILVALFALTTRAMNGSDPPAKPGEADLTVIGHQWWWEVRYKSGAVTANEIHIPTGRPLRVKFQSADVVHDFWVPDLARKIDVIPGADTSIEMQADDAGTFLGACAEYCGDQHAWMRILVVAEPPEVFAEWERRQLESAPAPATESAERGKQVFETRTCVGCHALSPRPGVASPSAAPDLTHVGSRSTLGAGVIPKSPADMAEWLRHPQVVKTGSHMPDVRLTDGEITDLTAYLEGLK
jgi:cytochrome c oxidase subunit 2